MKEVKIQPAVDCVITPAQMQELSKLLGVNLDSTDALINRCRSVSSVKIEGQSINFEPGLIQRLKSRCPASVDFNMWLRDRVREWAHGYVGW